MMFELIYIFDLPFAIWLVVTSDVLLHLIAYTLHTFYQPPGHGIATEKKILP